MLEVDHEALQHAARTRGDLEHALATARQAREAAVRAGNTDLVDAADAVVRSVQASLAALAGEPTDDT